MFDLGRACRPIASSFIIMLVACAHPSIVFGADQSTSAADTATLAPLQNDGAAPVSTKAAEVKLKEMAESLHRIKVACADLGRECCRLDEGMYGGGMYGGTMDCIGSDVFPILPPTAMGFADPRVLPPRKKYIDLHMTQLSMLMPMLQDEINNNTAPDAKEAQESKGYRDEMASLMKTAGGYYQKLQKATASQPYKSDDIVAQATGLHQTVDAIDKFRKDLAKGYKR